MKICHVLLAFLLLQVISCTPGDYGPAFVSVTNKSEYNITRVSIRDVRAGLVIMDERDNELIAKGGNSKTFKINLEDTLGKFAVCVEAEDTPELMCSIDFVLGDSEKIFFTWGGDSSSAWNRFVIQ
ncbi:MAG: hypothetical protein FWB90_00370 [Fibromonadales bacterium]|nr:hypothetical protein [Fibromonadales bacterium]